MNKEFKIIKKEVTGNVNIKVDTQINYLNADIVTVEENTTARLFGKIHKLLVLRNNSKVFLHGSIYGAVNNAGGELHVFEENSK